MRRATKSPKRGALASLALACCILLTACPPEGGDLLPVARGEGASLATKEFENDTLVVARGGLTLRARGRWSVADADTSVILEAANAKADRAAIDFGRAALVKDDGQGRMSLRSVTRESGAGGAAVVLDDKTAKIEGGGSATFVLAFIMVSEDGRSGVPRDLTGQTATLRVPVEVRAGMPATEFAFGFKYAGRAPRR
jgi:hypothetical protein